VGWLYAAERSQSGVWHVHALVIGVQEADWKAAQTIWEARNGLADVRPVFEGNGAVLYVTKNAWEQGDVILSDTLQRYQGEVRQDIVVNLHAVKARGAGGQMETTTAVQRVAQTSEARVSRLRHLTEDMTERYLSLARALYEEHEAELWTQVRARTGGRYQSEEEFWEEAIGVKRRTAYQLIRIGRILTEIGPEAESQKALVGVGLCKMDVLVPILEREPTVVGLQKWAEVARTNSREALREQVQKALERPIRPPGDPGERFERMMKGAMPDLESRTVAENFFRIGKEHVGSENPVAVVIAGMQECISSWEKPATR
jgi:hypothetical protein